MIDYDFGADYLRVNGKLPLFIKNPVSEKILNIKILVEDQDLNNLVYLIPKVEILTLSFCDNDPRYDISSLIKLKDLSELRIKGFWNKQGPRLLKLNRLKKLKLRKLRVYGKKLDPMDPVYPWPKIRIPEFSHIKNITILGKVINYELRAPDDGEEFSGENIYLQKLTNTQFQLIYYYSEGNRAEKIKIEIISAKKFYKYLFTKSVPEKNPWYPKTMEDLYTDDDD